MGRKKNPNKENPSAEAPHDISEQLASLKALNNVLVRQTVENREQIHTLRISNESLESKIATTIANYRTLEQDKSLCQDRMLVAEIEREIGILVVSSELSKIEMYPVMAQRLKYLEEERGELFARLDELEEIKLREMQEEVDRLIRDMGWIQSDLDAKKKEADELRFMLEVEKVRNEKGGEEMGSLQMQFNQIRQEKMEMEERFESVRGERDSIQKTLHDLTAQHEDLRREIKDAVKEKYEIEAARNEMGVKIARLQKEVDLLTAELCSNRDALDRVLKERAAVQNKLDLQKEEGRRTKESLLAEKGSVERRLMESSQLNADLKKKMEEMAEEKDEIEQAKAEKEAAIAELLNEVGRLGATISTLKESCDDLTKTNSQLVQDLNHQKDLLGCVRGERDAAREQIAQLKDEGNGLRLKVHELEKNNGEVREELKRAMGELDGLMEERKEGVVKLELLIEEKTALLGRLDSVMGRMRELVEEKGAIEQKRIEQEHQIKQLQEEVGWLNTTVTTLRESCKEGEEKNNLLQADINHVLAEKDVLSADLNQQRQEAEGLRSKIREMEKIQKENEQGLVQLKTTNDNLVEEMEERERCFEMMMKAKTSTESSLMESTQKLKDLQIKIEFAEMVSHRALSMLKQAAEMVSASENEENGLKGEDTIDGTEEMSNEIQPFAKELEAIERAYRRRLHEVEDMNLEINSLQLSIAESKKRSMLTLLSSATTVLAAISFAFVARRR